ncbi:Histone-lysine N-methyltransferase SMYD3 [Portunus trituberculatus]|uniref:Histone-lysine N-methyltransferase SMYD3 n=1 Tax=Portunus trituberculatus TaxID=210409 RepID=A0A5B7ER16_PORTR|nr:Histone-lysine N-methyltransferase SMYD3 [Portunus trituberculatus]
MLSESRALILATSSLQAFLLALTSAPSYRDTLLRPCPECRVVWYCGDKCREEGHAWHRLECPALKRRQHNLPPNYVRLLARVILRLRKTMEETEEEEEEQEKEKEKVEVEKKEHEEKKEEHTKNEQADEGEKEKEEKEKKVEVEKEEEEKIEEHTKNEQADEREGEGD